MRNISLALLSTLALCSCDADSNPSKTESPDASMAEPDGGDLFVCPTVSSEMPYSSKFVEVHGSQMHYVEDGIGEVILLLHGQPVSAYFWRNVIPHVSDGARVIAMDHIGFGKSDKPNIDYTVEDQVRYLEGFIEALDLENITLVVQDVGSLTGLIYASEHSDKIRAVAMMEALIPPVVPITSESAPPEIFGFWQLLKDPIMGPVVALDGNVFFDDVMGPNGMTLPGALGAFTLCGPSPEAEAEYRKPFLDRDSRLPLLAAPRSMPIDGQPAALNERFIAYSNWLQTSQIPKLVIAATPGVLISEETAEWAGENLPNTTVSSIGPGLHFLAESRPDAVGTALSEWFKNL